MMAASSGCSSRGGVGQDGLLGSQPTTFWGKLQRDANGAVVAWHPLIAHSADVAACVEALLTFTILGRRLARIGARPGLSTADIAALSALAALHDIGKFNHGFQRKADRLARDIAGHVREVLTILCSDYEVGHGLRRALPTDALQSWTEDDSAWCLLVAGIGHHGKPVRCGDGSPSPDLWLPGADRDPFAGIAELTGAVRRWFPEAFVEGAVRLPSNPEFQHAFSGLVMLADWLGSDCRPHMFPYATSLEDRMPFARERAKAALDAVGLDPTMSRAALGAEPPGFSRISAYVPRDAQEKTLALPLDVEGSVSVLESETGSGKTEAALARFLQLFHAGLVDGMTLALPTRSAATQIHRRVVDAMKRAFPNEDERPGVVLAVPGYLMIDDARGHRPGEGDLKDQRLARFDVLWNDDASERTRHLGWAVENSKRYLAGTVVVGTVDQVLLSSLRVAHSHLRASALLRHFLVVDEVHASDAYMTRVLEEVLRFHLSAGGHALLMSATLGSEARARLTSTVRKQPRPPVGSLAEALNVTYPAVHHASAATAPRILPIESPGLPKTVRVECEAIASDHVELTRRALLAARAGARVLILRNTVSDAISSQLSLEDGCDVSDRQLLFRARDRITIHHSRFSRDDRRLLDEAIERDFGEPEKIGGVIAVCTQTVQQSLDLDADFLFTDLAPMDVLLQRFGRLHRHRARDPHRAQGFKEPRVVVLLSEIGLSEAIGKNGSARGEHGIGTVYEDLCILEATKRLLTPARIVRIPEENRELIERTTHTEILEEIATSSERWRQHRSCVDGMDSAKKGIARLNIVERDKLFGEFSFDQAGLCERIASRLGESDRRARFDPALEGPFGTRVSELTIPAWLLKGQAADPEAAPSDVRVEQGRLGLTLRFAFAGVDLLYDRLGLRRPDPESLEERV